MKIAYIVLKGMPLGGGIEKYTEELGSRLVNKGHEIIVFTMKHYGASNGYYKGMKIKTIPTIKNRSLEKITAALIATIKNCLEDNSEIVHFHAFGPSLFSFIPKIFGRKVVVQGHGIEWKRSRWSWIEKTFLKLAEIPSVKFPDIVTVVSNVQKKYLKNKYNIESIYIPPGINRPRILPPQIIKKYGLYGNDYILFAARLVKEKGAHYLIEAYNKIKSDIKLVIAGDAKHEEVYKSQLYRMSYKNKNIIFVGFATGKMLYELFSNCYLFVSPSELEGLPIAILEAMSYGNCCLVSDIPENLEAISSYGYTFRSKNVNDLKDKLEYLIKNSEIVNSIKQAAREYVLQKYSWDYTAEQFENLYLNLLKRYK